MPGPNVPYTVLDAGQVVRQAFDEQTDRIRVDAQVTATLTAIEVEIDAADGDNIAISDGSNTATLSIVGARTGLDVNVVNFPGSDGLEVSSYFDEVTGVPSSSLTTILSHSCLGPSIMEKIDVSGDNIAKFYIKVNNVIQDVKRTYFGNSLNLVFDFKDGLKFDIGDTIVVQVEHNRPTVSAFNARLKIKE